MKSFILNRTKPAVPVKEIRSDLSALGDKLETLLSGSEDKFLYIGSSLQDFSAKSRELSTMSERVVTLTSGEEIANITSGLREQLGKMSQYLGQGKDSSVCNMEKLQNASKVIEKLEGVYSDFDKITRMLQFLSVSIQVENARIDKDKTGFATVSSEIKKLANSIETKSRNVLINSRSLATLIHNATARTQELSKRQQSSTLDIVKNIELSLEALIDLNKKSALVSNRVAKRSSEIHKNIGDVVASLQFHDITRQQMEHVRDSLKHTQERLENVEQGNGSVSRDQKTELMGWVSKVCEVQLSQLQNTRNKLGGAVGSVIKDLRGIAGNVSDMAVDAQALSGDDQMTGSSILLQVEGEITTVIKSLRDNEAMEREISDSIGSAVNGMVEFVKEIEGIGARIKLIALNAQVQASCLGDEGKTFGVLSEEIQRLSVDARAKTAVVLENLNLITVEGEGSHTGAEALPEKVETEYDNVVNVFEELLGSINRIDKEFIDTSNSITECGEGLSKEIEAFTGQIIFHEDMVRAIDEVVKGFSNVRDYIHRLFPGSVSSSKAVGLETLEAAYTMHSQREIHQHATQRTPVLVGAGVNNAENNDPEEYSGDNIELF